MPDIITVNSVPFHVLRKLGKGKSGHSWLVEKDGVQRVIKQLHHEPCDYYQFDDKLAAEQRDYKRLLAAGIRVPELIDVDVENERILKAYIPGPTIFELVRDDGMRPEYLAQIRAMASQALAAGLNIDYFPTNFVVYEGLIHYVDYECNDFMDAWSFERWGIRYWSRTPEFMEYLTTGKAGKRE